jgi:hypothetical protein
MFCIIYTVGKYVYLLKEYLYSIKLYIISCNIIRFGKELVLLFTEPSYKIPKLTVE